MRHAGWHELKLGNVRGRICLDVRWERMRILELSNKLKERKPFGWARECPEDLSVCQVEKINKEFNEKLKK